MGPVGITLFLALAAAPPTDVHTEPPSGGTISAFVRCGLLQDGPPISSKDWRRISWLGPDLGAAIAGASHSGNPNCSGFALSLAALGLHESTAFAGGAGYFPGSFGVASAETQTDINTFDTVVFTRAGFPSGTAIRVRIELGASASFVRQFRETPRDDGHVTLQCTLDSDMLRDPAAIEFSTLAMSMSPQFAQESRVVTIFTGVEYRLKRAQLASVSPLQVGVNQQSSCGGYIRSRVAIHPMSPDVSIASRASVLYTPCPSDLDMSWFVDDADFLLFAAAYALGDCADPAMPDGCSADLNYDGIVDAADFVLFLPAYDEGICPLFGDIDFGPQ